MAKTGKTLQALATEIDRQARAKRDYIAPVSRLGMDTSGDLVLQLPKDPMLQLPERREALPVTQLAHTQIAEFLKIPADYYKRVLASQPELLAAHVNHWLLIKEMDAAERKEAAPRRNVRVLDNRVRAVLSDGYRPLDNEDLAAAVLPALADLGVTIISCDITDTRLYIKAIDERVHLDVPTGRKIGDGSHVFFDTCSPGISISNSEVGFGALLIETSIYTGMCTNLCTMGAVLRKMHAGKRAELSDEVFALLTDETKRKTDEATWLQARDLVKAAFDEARFAANCKRLGEAAEQVIAPAEVVETVTRLGKRYTLSEGERDGILTHLINGGDVTRYGLHAAVTRSAQDVESYDRASWLERLGGQIIELPKPEWKTLAEAA